MEIRARFGCTAAPGSTDDPRMRRITEQFPPAITAQLLARHAAGAGEAELRDLLGSGPGHVYFQDRGRRAAGLEVTVTDPAWTNAPSPHPLNQRADRPVRAQHRVAQLEQGVAPRGQARVQRRPEV